MKKLIFILLLSISQPGYSQVGIRQNPMNCNVKFWIEEGSHKIFNNSYIDSLQETYQIMISKDSVVGQDTAYLTFQKKLISEVKKEEEDWLNNIIGTKFIDFEMPDLNGKIIHNKLFKNNFLVVDLSSFYCGPCIKEIPEFNQLSESLSNENVGLIAFFNEDTIAMNQMFSNPVITEKLLNGQKAHFSYTVIPDAKSVIDHYKIYAFPTHMIIDDKGIIRNVIIGVPHNEETNEITVVETMQAELKKIGFSKTGNK